MGRPDEPANPHRGRGRHRRHYWRSRALDAGGIIALPERDHNSDIAAGTAGPVDYAGTRQRASASNGSGSSAHLARSSDPRRRPPAPHQAATPPATAGPAITPDDRILGRADAPITIVEFASLTCPHCADFDANTLPKLKAEWIDTGKARLVFKDFPLDQAAVRAAMLARCAPPEQFYPFLDALFHSQTNWATGGKVEAALSKLAKLSGMSDDQFAACMSDDAVQKRVLDSRLAAEQQYKVESTPTFFINGIEIVGAQPYAEFERVLNNAASKL